MGRMTMSGLGASVLFAAGAAFGDFVWPTATTGRDGDLSSSGSDGWDSVGNTPQGKGSVWFYGGGTYTASLTNGTEWTGLTNASVNVRNMKSKDEAHVTLEVANAGSHLPIGTLQMGDSADDPNGTMRLYAHDGGKISILKAFNPRTVNQRFEFRSGAIFDTTAIYINADVGYAMIFNGTGGDWGTGVPTYTPMDTRIVFDNAIWNAKQVMFGYGNSWNDTAFSFAATNSTLNFTRLDINANGTYALKGGTLCVNEDTEVHCYYATDTTLDGVAVTNGKWRVGYVREEYLLEKEASLTIKGGAKVHINGISTAWSTNSIGRAYVTGEGTEVCYGGMFDYGATYIGEKGRGYLTVADGASIMLGADTGFNGGNPVALGDTAGSYGEFNIDGGHVRMQDFYGIWVGRNGCGQLNIKAGDLQTSRLCVGFAASSGATSRIRQTGGTALVGNDTGKIDNNENCTLFLAKESHPSELVLEGGVFEVGKVVGGTAAQAKIIGNGGTLRRSTATYAGDYTGTKKFVSNLAGVEVGAKGLAVDTNGKDGTFEAAVGNYGGEQGVFVKDGDGTLSYSGAMTAAFVAVRGGTLLLADAAPVLSSTVVVTNGATFSTVGAATGATLGGLVVTNAVLALDPDDTLTVNGPISLSRVKLELSDALTLDDAKSLLVANGETDAATALAWKTAVSDIALAEGTHPSFTTEYDADTGKTTFKLTVRADVPLTETTTWQGADDAWSETDNWLAGLPAATKIAAFADNGASTSVTLPSGATAGALAFAGQNFTLSGGALYLPAEQGASRIDAAAGSTNVIAAPVTMDLVTTVEPATQGAVALTGGITGGGLVKKGAGRLTLGGASAFAQYLQMDGGVLTATAEGAFGTGDTDIRHRFGTVAFDLDEATTVAQTYRTRATNATDVTIINNASDVTISDWRPERGKFLKRGPGKLTLKSKPGTWSLTDTKFDSSSSGSVVFPEDGSTPQYATGGTMLWPGITVGEGELELTSDTPNAEISAVMTMLSGFQTLDGSVDPCLTIRGVRISCGGDDTLGVGRGQASLTSSFTINPRFRMIDAYFKTANINLGTWCYGSGAHQHVALTNSTLYASWQMQLAQANDGNNKASSVITAKDSEMIVWVNQGGFTWFAGVEANLDNTYFGAITGTGRTPTKFTGASQWSHGYMAFRNGSIFAIDTINFTDATHDMKFVFDDATWNFGTGDFTLGADNVNVGKFSLEMQGTGLIVAPASGKTLTLDVPVTGEGGFVSRGAGTVAFGENRYQFTGKLVAEAGVIDLTNAGTVTNATIGAGAGAIKGGTFHNATIALGTPGGAVPAFEDCTFTGMTRVTFAGEPAKLSGVTVANVTGALTGLGTFRIRGWGNLVGTFALKDGKVTVDVRETGFAVIVR